ncbi:hypothetical protein NC652_037084 [Populus alba x Populus x berolinensis]|nr:hypothetical protein NC652_037084 [Populus alba x Populus x berolinensis]
MIDQIDNKRDSNDEKSSFMAFVLCKRETNQWRLYCLDRSGICQHWIESQVLLFLETPFAYLSTLRFSASVIEAQKRKEGLFV